MSSFKVQTLTFSSPSQAVFSATAKRTQVAQHRPDVAGAENRVNSCRRPKFKLSFSAVAKRK